MIQLEVRYHNKQKSPENPIFLQAQGLPIRRTRISIETEKKSMYRIRGQNQQQNQTLNDSRLSQRKQTADVESALFTSNPEGQQSKLQNRKLIAVQQSVMSNYNSFERQNTEKTLNDSPQTCIIKENQFQQRTLINANIVQQKSIKVDNLRDDVIDEEKGSIISHNLQEQPHVGNRDKFINHLYQFEAQNSKSPGINLEKQMLKNQKKIELKNQCEQIEIKSNHENEDKISQLNDIQLKKTKTQMNKEKQTQMKLKLNIQKQNTNLDSELDQSGLPIFNNSVSPFFNDNYSPANSILKSSLGKRALVLDVQNKKVPLFQITSNDFNQHIKNEVQAEKSTSSSINILPRIKVNQPDFPKQINEKPCRQFQQKKLTSIDLNMKKKILSPQVLDQQKQITKMDEVNLKCVHALKSQFPRLKQNEKSRDQICKDGFYAQRIIQKNKNKNLQVDNSIQKKQFENSTNKFELLDKIGHKTTMNVSKQDNEFQFFIDPNQIIENKDYLEQQSPFNNIFMNSSSQASPFEFFDQFSNEMHLNKQSNLNSLKEISLENQNDIQKSNEKSTGCANTQQNLDQNESFTNKKKVLNSQFNQNQHKNMVKIQQKRQSQNLKITSNSKIREKIKISINNFKSQNNEFTRESQERINTLKALDREQFNNFNIFSEKINQTIYSNASSQMQFNKTIETFKSKMDDNLKKKQIIDFQLTFFSNKKNEEIIKMMQQNRQKSSLNQNLNMHFKNELFKYNKYVKRLRAIDKINEFKKDIVSQYGQNYRNSQLIAVRQNKDFLKFSFNSQDLNQKEIIQKDELNQKSDHCKRVNYLKENYQSPDELIQQTQIKLSQRSFDQKIHLYNLKLNLNGQIKMKKFDNSQLINALFQDDNQEKKINSSFQSRPLKNDDYDVISIENPFCSSTLDSKQIRLANFIQNHQIVTKKQDRNSHLLQSFNSTEFNNKSGQLSLNQSNFNISQLKNHRYGNFQVE